MLTCRAWRWWKLHQKCHLHCFSTGYMLSSAYRPVPYILTVHGLLSFSFRVQLHLLEGVTGYSHAHFWQLSSSSVVGTIHVQVSPTSNEQKVAQAVSAVLKEGGATNLTVQVEKEPFTSSNLAHSVGQHNGTVSVVTPPQVYVDYGPVASDVTAIWLYSIYMHCLCSALLLYVCTCIVSTVHDLLVECTAMQAQSLHFPLQACYVYCVIHKLCTCRAPAHKESTVARYVHRFHMRMLWSSFLGAWENMIYLYKITWKPTWSLLQHEI